MLCWSSIYQVERWSLSRGSFTSVQLDVHCMVSLPPGFCQMKCWVTTELYLSGQERYPLSLLCALCFQTAHWAWAGRAAESKTSVVFGAFIFTCLAGVCICLQDSNRCAGALLPFWTQQTARLQWSHKVRSFSDSHYSLNCCSPCGLDLTFTSLNSGYLTPICKYRPYGFACKICQAAFWPISGHFCSIMQNPLCFHGLVKNKM